MDGGDLSGVAFLKLHLPLRRSRRPNPWTAGEDRGSGGTPRRSRWPWGTGWQRLTGNGQGTAGDQGNAHSWGNVFRISWGWP